MSLTIHTGPTRAVTAQEVSGPSGRHRATPTGCRTLSVALLAATAVNAARSAVAEMNWRPLRAVITAASGFALFAAMLEEGAEFAFGGEVPHLLIAAALLVALVLYGARTGTGETPPGVGFLDVVYFAAIGAAVIAESADFWLGQEWEHLAIIAAIAVATCIYAIRCWTQD